LSYTYVYLSMLILWKTTKTKDL